MSTTQIESRLEEFYNRGYSNTALYQKDLANNTIGVIARAAKFDLSQDGNIVSWTIEGLSRIPEKVVKAAMKYVMGYSPTVFYAIYGDILSKKEMDGFLQTDEYIMGLDGDTVFFDITMSPMDSQSTIDFLKEVVVRGILRGIIGHIGGDKRNRNTAQERYEGNPFFALNFLSMGTFSKKDWEKGIENKQAKLVAEEAITQEILRTGIMPQELMGDATEEEPEDIQPSQESNEEDMFDIIPATPETIIQS